MINLQFFYLLLFIIFILGVVIEFTIFKNTDRNYYNLFDLKNTGLSMIWGALVELLISGTALASLYYVYDFSIWKFSFSIFTWIACFVIWDFVFYWKHYLEHNIRILWAVHIIHHSSPYFNLSTALRSGIFKGFYRYIFYLPIIIIGFHPTMFLVVYGLGKLWAYFSHSQKLGNWDFISNIFVTPLHHAIHHSYNEENINKNFGETFIIWDKIFGTYRTVEYASSLVYGIPQNKIYENHSNIFLQEFYSIYNDIKKSNSLKNIFQVVFFHKINLKETTNVGIKKEQSIINFHKLKYKNREEEISKVLKTRVNQYFKSNGISKYANLEVWLKIAFIFTTMIASYFAVMSNYFSAGITLLFTLIFGFSCTMMGFNVAHDAAHHALSKHKWVNNLLARSMCLIGCSSYVWHLRHNLSHHAHCNIPEYDWTTYAHKKILTSESNFLLRWLSKYPHYYTPILYSFYFVFLTFYKDFHIFFNKNIGKSCAHHPSRMDTFLFILSKIVYYFVVILLPLYWLKFSIIQIVFGYLVMHGVSGFIFSLIAIPPHLTHDAVFMHLEQDKLDSNRFLHNVETTTDFARQSKLINWVFGGFNTHSIHHLYPNICHVHYIPLSKILKDTMNEFGYVYKETTLWQAIKSHLLFLKNLNRK